MFTPLEVPLLKVRHRNVVPAEFVLVGRPVVGAERVVVSAGRGAAVRQVAVLVHVDAVLLDRVHVVEPGHVHPDRQLIPRPPVNLTERENTN